MTFYVLTVVIAFLILVVGYIADIRSRIETPYHTETQVHETRQEPRIPLSGDLQDAIEQQNELHTQPVYTKIDRSRYTTGAAKVVVVLNLVAYSLFGIYYNVVVKSADEGKSITQAEALANSYVDATIGEMLPPKDCYGRVCFRHRGNPDMRCYRYRNNKGTRYVCMDKDIKQDAVFVPPLEFSRLFNK